MSVSPQILTTTPFKDHAQRLARLGFFVFPCIGKIPAIKGGKGFKDATMDTAILQAWADDYPTANIGIRTGREANLVVLDVDAYKIGVKESWEMLCAGLVFETMTAISGGGGTHYYFSYPDGVESIPSRVFPLFSGIDVKADGGCIIAPPSLHPNGNAYRWATQGIRPCPLPLALYERIKPDVASMNGHPAAIFDDLLNRLSGVSVTARDGEYTARCPYHDDDHPSLSVNINKGVFHCFACHAGGTLRDLANRLGIPPPSKTSLDSLNHFPMTDAGNAEALIDLFGAHTRFDHQADTWMLFDGHHWRRDVDGGIHRQALETIRQRRNSAPKASDEEAAKRLWAWAVKSESSQSRKALLDTAKSLHPITDAGEQWDMNPDLLGVANGVLDLKTGEYRPGCPDDLITRRSAVVYQPDAVCPHWMTFLEELFETHPPDEQTAIREYLQRAVGYSLTGHTTEQVVFLAHGSGGNGKTTFLERIVSLLGEYSTKIGVETLMTTRVGTIRDDLAKLAAMRLVVAMEPDETHQLAENVVKELTGGDTITARHLYGRYFNFRPRFKIWLGANHKPNIRGTDEGIWRRIRLIPFLSNFADRTNPHLAEILDTELPGILNWAVIGAQWWYQHGRLETPDIVKVATSAYRQESDSLGQFLADCTHAQPLAKTKASKFYDAYKRWAGTNGHDPMNATRFGRELGLKGLTRTHQESGNYYNGYELLELRDDDRFEFP